MSIEDAGRAEFEKWATQNGLSVVRTPQALMFANGQRRAIGDYIMVESLCAWGAWQYSRASIQIQLPETPNRGIGYGLFDAGKEACRAAIEAAGLRVSQP